MEKKAGEQIFAGMVDEVLATRIVNRAESNRAQSNEETERKTMSGNGHKHATNPDPMTCCRGKGGIVCAVIAVVVGVIGIVAVVKVLKKLRNRD